MGRVESTNVSVLRPTGYFPSCATFGGWALLATELAVIADLLEPDMTFVDCGAHIGQFTVFAAKRLPRGHVFARSKNMPTLHAIPRSALLGCVGMVPGYRLMPAFAKLPAVILAAPVLPALATSWIEHCFDAGMRCSCVVLWGSVRSSG